MRYDGDAEERDRGELDQRRPAHGRAVCVGQGGMHGDAGEHPADHGREQDHPPAMDGKDAAHKAVPRKRQPDRPDERQVRGPDRQAETLQQQRAEKDCRHQPQDTPFLIGCCAQQDRRRRTPGHLGV